VADSGGPHAGVAAWLTVFLIVAGFIVGVVALIAHNSPIIWGAAAAVLVLGGILGLTSRIMELGH
jgi:disulfide bond formation protein DsbB